MSAHKSPEQIRSQLKHPIVDGDGHWVEFPPVFAEKMRKVGGDKAADGFLAPRGAGEGLKMTPAERTERRIAQPNFWNRQGDQGKIGTGAGGHMGGCTCGYQHARDI